MTADPGINAKIDYKMTTYPQLQEEYDKLRVVERITTHDVMRIARENGVELNGIEYSAKSASSVEDKLTRLEKKSYIKPEKLLPKMNDLIRYTQICAHDDIFSVAKKTIESLEKEGYKLSVVNNYYKHNYPKTGYKGLHLNFITPQGRIMEMQIHSEGSFEAKQRGHELYEKIRAVSTPIEEKDRLQPLIYEIHQQVPDPPGYDSLDDYQMDPQERDELIKERINNTQIQLSHKMDGDLDCISFLVSTSDGGQSLIEGFEIHQSDGSIAEGVRHDGKDVKYSAYTKDGEKTYEETKEMSRDEHLIGFNVLDAAKVNEMLSNMWDAKSPELAGIPKDTTIADIRDGVKNSDETLTKFIDKYNRIKEVEGNIHKFCSEKGVSRDVAVSLLDHELKDHSQRKVRNTEMDLSR